MQCEMQSVSSRIWTHIAVFISYGDNDYTTGTSYNDYTTGTSYNDYTTGTSVTSIGPQRKLMTMHMALHPRDDVDRISASRKEGGRGITSSKDTVNTSIQRLEDCTEKRGGRLVIATRNNTWQHEDRQNGNDQKNREKNKSMDVLRD